MTKSQAQKLARRLRRANVKIPMGKPTVKKNKGAASQPKRKRNKNKQNFKNSPIGAGNNRLSLGSGVSNYSTTRRSQVVEEDEYIGEVSGSVSFATTSFSVNPGQSTTFPWGSKVAQLYEEYEFEYLEFYYKREVSEFATNGQAGKVILSFDYDASDSAPATKQQVEDSDPHVDGMPCTPLLRLPIDKVMMKKGDAKFVRPGAQPANTDIKTYDVGNLIVSTQGCTNTTTIGELHVRYRVRFSKPVLDAATVVGGVVHFSAISATTGANLTNMVLQSGGTPSLTGITMTAQTITFPANIPGNFLVQVNLMGATSCSALSFASGTATALNIQTVNATRDAIDANASLAGTTSNFAALTLTVSVPVGGGTIVLGGGTIVGTGSGDVFITSLPASVLTSIKKYNSAEIDTLRDRLSRMEEMFSCASISNNHVTVRQESDSDCDSFLEQKETDLVKSVHISSSMAQKLSKALLG